MGGKYSSTPVFIKEENQVLGKLIHMLNTGRILGICFSDSGKLSKAVLASWVWAGSGPGCAADGA